MLDPTLDVERTRALVAWALTYLVHGTLLLGAAWILTARFARLGPAAREWIWRGALLGSLVTATCATWTGTLGGAPTWVLPGRAVATDGAVDVPANDDPAFVLPEEGFDPTAADVEGVASGAEPRALPPSSASATPPETGLALAIGAWLLGACLVLQRFDRRRRRLRRILRARLAIAEGELHAELVALARTLRIRRRVALSSSRDLATPISFGLWRPEVCVPERVLHELLPAERRALLAHELAHVQRLDPVWIALQNALATLFFFQPLLRVARRQLHETAEILCDACAVRVTREPLGLARCLAKVAEWLLEGEGAPEPHAVSAMAASPSALGGRIRALLDGSCTRPGRAGIAALFLVPCLVATAFAAPHVVSLGDPAIAHVEGAEREAAAERLVGEIDAFEERWARLAAAFAALDDVPRAALAEADPALLREVERLRRSLAELAPLRERLLRWRASRIEPAHPSPVIEHP